MARILGLKQLHQKRYKLLEGIPDNIKAAFGELTAAFIAIIWGKSGNGKSNFLIELLLALMEYGKVLHISLEEGHEKSFQNLIFRHLDVDKHTGKIEFADYEMTFEALMVKLKKKKSPQFIVIDSLQYWKITFDQYKILKETFPKKTFIFISHALGKMPKGGTAQDIQYDAGIKVRVEGYIAFVTSRYGGVQNFVIWEDGAKKYWAKKYKTMLTKKL
ncbi:hypothetical protein SAMN05428988_1337 [Chitinophaga sp. YR573]|uniref:hypothetical protein n=1 Tax=Chitinophaga sp. YR573 TaxID=1881040 RepID=UPI0008CE0493|nr:hypothetical protein [Chitinophaga sp. YR573]SEW02186.1 hypothetical protein SAMN05428988_1337 [Chitinophaga sp. YR573]